MWCCVWSGTDLQVALRPVNPSSSQALETLRSCEFPRNQFVQIIFFEKWHNCRQHSSTLTLMLMLFLTPGRSPMTLKEHDWFLLVKITVLTAIRTATPSCLVDNCNAIILLINMMKTASGLADDDIRCLHYRVVNEDNKVVTGGLKACPVGLGKTFSATPCFCLRHDTVLNILQVNVLSISKSELVIPLTTCCQSTNQKRVSWRHLAMGTGYKYDNDL